MTHHGHVVKRLWVTPRLQMEAAHEARLVGEAVCGENPAARAEHPRLSPAQKMEKMRLWFERNKGIPPRDTSPGFDMGPRDVPFTGN